MQQDSSKLDPNKKTAQTTYTYMVLTMRKEKIKEDHNGAEEAKRVPCIQLRTPHVLPILTALSVPPINNGRGAASLNIRTIFFSCLTDKQRGASGNFFTTGRLVKSCCGISHHLLLYFLPTCTTPAHFQEGLLYIIYRLA